MHARQDMRSCMILQDFMMQKDVRAYKQLLTLDFYLRENAKSRPLFAGDERISKKSSACSMTVRMKRGVIWKIMKIWRSGSLEK